LRAISPALCAKLVCNLLLFVVAYPVKQYTHARSLARSAWQRGKRLNFQLISITLPRQFLSVGGVHRRKSGHKNVITVGEFLPCYIGALNKCAAALDPTPFPSKENEIATLLWRRCSERGACLLSALSLIHFNYFCISKGAIKLGINIHYSRSLHYAFSLSVQKALA
jgi:hypothetical protein